MKVLLIIPARGGSKRIPRKNIRPMLGKPLIVYSIEHAKASKLVNRIVVSTDDAEIAKISEKNGAEVVVRPKEISNDTASSESALLHVLDHLEEKEGYVPDLVVFLQCTSPIRKKDETDNAIRLLVDSGADSLFSACKNDKFIWELGKEGPKSINYDYRSRKREQDMPPQFRENGSVYVFRPDILRKYNNRLGGKMIVYEMDYWSSFQIDSQEDWELIEWILKNKARERGYLA